MKITIVGSLGTVFVHSYALSMSVSGVEVQVVNVSGEVRSSSLAKEIDVVHARYPTPVRGYWKSRIKKILVTLRLDRNSLLISMLSAFSKKGVSRADAPWLLSIQQFSPDAVFFFWSTTVRREVLSVAEAIVQWERKPKLVLGVNTYPVRSASAYLDKNEELLSDRSYFSQFNHVFLTSEVMRKYFKLHELPMPKTSLALDLFCADFFASNLENEANFKSLVFLGTTEFSSRTIDNVFPFLSELTQSGLKVYVQNSETVKDASGLQYFAPYSYEQIARGKLGDFIASFGAAIVAYNDLGGARGANSFPTRFALAMLGLVPIFIRKGQFLAIEERFKDDPILCLYENSEEIISFLNDDGLLQERRAAIRARSEHYKMKFDLNFWSSLCDS